MARQAEIIFDEKTGKFVVHFSGYTTHAEEHAALDQILAQLQKQGFRAELKHFHDKPSIPEIEEERGVRGARKTH